MKIAYIQGAAVAAVALTLLAGCLMTSTVVITAGLSPNAAGEKIIIRHNDYTQGELEVDLTNDPTFKDYRDDIRNVDNIGFYVEATNNFFGAVTFQLFLEPDTSANYTSAQEVVDSLTDIILTGASVPARSTVIIDWDESMEYVTNLDEFRQVLEGGVFSLYPVCIPRDNFNVTLDSLVVIITLTGNK